MVRTGWCCAVALLFAVNVSAQEPVFPVEPLGTIATAGGIDVIVEQRNTILTESGGTTKQQFLALSPGISDAKGSFTSNLLGGYIFNGAKAGVEALGTYANVGIETGSISRDLFAFRGKVKYVASSRLNLAGVVDQRHLEDSYNRTKVLFAGDFRLTKATSAIKVTAVANAGFVRNSPETGASVDDSVFGVGLITGFTSLGKLSVGVDYRPRNDVEGDEAVSATFRHPVGPGTVQYSVDKKGGMSVSYLTLF